MNYDKKSLFNQLRVREGNKRSMYRDPMGFDSIGVGHNLARPIPQEAVDVILAADVADAEKDLDVLLAGWRAYDPVRQQALVHLSFALGRPRLSLFKKMLSAIKADDWTSAASELYNSAWSIAVGREPGQRADEVSKMLALGGECWPPENGG